VLQPLGAPAPERGCDVCGTPLRKRFSRVAVRYTGWGFRATDSLVREPGRSDFGELRERAERIADGERPTGAP
jgi:predicted nucleic acid-binding Zn ribbon protein